MGDPLGTAASIIAVLQLSASVIQYINTARGATEDRKRLREEVRACEYILRQLKDEVDDSEEGTAWLETVNALEAQDAPLGRLWAALNTVKSKLRPKQGIQKKLTSLKWPFSEKEVEKMFAIIEREKALLNLALQNNSRKLIQEIKKTATENKQRLEDLMDAINSHSTQIHDELGGLKDGVESIRNDQNEEKDARQREKIIKWLTRIDYAAQQSDYIARRQPGTGQWLLDSVEFTTWVESSKQTLFCPGIPGAGKTILTSIVIDNLMARFHGSETVGVAYLYCDFKRHSDQTAAYLLTDILKQLSQRRLKLPDCVQTLYSSCEGRGKIAPLFGDISRTLQSVCRLYDKVFVVVDALDECQASQAHRSTLLKEIFDLQAKYEVNIFATSRFIPEISQMFANSLAFEIRAQPEDVGKYVDSRILELPSFVQERPDLQAEIKNGIVKAVDGMFLLAQLQFESLAGKRSPKAVRTAISKLPSGPDAYVKTYEEALKRIDAQLADQVELAKQALSWIVCAQWPVTTTELRHALAVEVGEPEFDDENLSGVKDIISVCAGMVTVDIESDIVRLVHYTTQEFFARKQNQWLPHAQTDIAHTCVTYLSFDVFETGLSNSDKDLDERLRSNPLYKYAAVNWGYHARIAAAEASHTVSPPKLLEPGHPQEFRTPNSMQRIILAFFSNSKKLSASNQALNRALLANRYDGQWWESSHRDNLPTRLAAMHTAAYFGLRDIVVILLQQNHDLNARDMYGRTPLWLSSRNGHAMVVETLLQTTGIEPALRSSQSGETPLSVAAGHGHYEVVELFLDKLATKGGSDIQAEGFFSEEEVGLMTKDQYGLTPIWKAAAVSHEKVANLLLTRGADPNYRTDSTLETPLLVAVRYGHEGIVKMLLGWDGVDREPRDHYNDTPLLWATRGHRRDIIKLLLAQDGININCQNRKGISPLFEAARLGSQAIVETLLAQDKIDPDLANIYGQTPLSAASDYGLNGIVELLLAQDAVEPNSPDWKDRTPLHYAAARRHVAVVKSLVASSRVNVNAKTREGDTPLWLAVRESNLEVVRALLASDSIDMNCTDKDGVTPLAELGHWLSDGSVSSINCPEVQIAMLLLENERVDMNCKDSRGKTPFQHACKGRNLPAVELLLKNDKVEVNPRDKVGRTPLSRAAYCGHEAIAVMLLETDGVDQDSRDEEGRTPLSWAAEFGHEAITAKLLESHGVDPDSRDNEGRTPLSRAAECGYEAITTNLLESGAVNPDSRDNEGRTPLSRAVAPIPYMWDSFISGGVITSLLALDCVNPDTKDKRGRTPLSHAASCGCPDAESLRILLSKGDVDINSKDNDGRTPLSYAALYGRVEAVKLLMAGGRIDLNSTDNDGKTALALAAEAKDGPMFWLKDGIGDVIRVLSAVMVI